MAYVTASVLNGYIRSRLNGLDAGFTGTRNFNVKLYDTWGDVVEWRTTSTNGSVNATGITQFSTTAPGDYYVEYEYLQNNTVTQTWSSDWVTIEAPAVYYATRAFKGTGISYVTPSSIEEIEEGQIGYFEAEVLEGYTFSGWYNYYTGSYVSNRNPYQPYIYEQTYLTAEATPITYTISYNANGGSGAPSSQTVNYNNGIYLGSAPSTPKSYTLTYNANGGSVSPSSKSVSCSFSGWNTNSSGTGTTYSAGVYYTVTSNQTLYAKWTNPTAGTLTTPTRTGYTFDGWYTAANDGTKITSSSTISSNQTIYAHWTRITYSITYNANGGNGAPSTQTKTMELLLILALLFQQEINMSF